MRSNLDAAEEMIVALAGLLRAATDVSDRGAVPLRDELRVLERYVLIVKI
jgi:LytS/YehU family sensor histidine kinase